MTGLAHVLTSVWNLCMELCAILRNEAVYLKTAQKKTAAFNRNAVVST